MKCRGSCERSWLVRAKITHFLVGADGSVPSDMSYRPLLGPNSSLGLRSNAMSQQYEAFGNVLSTNTPVSCPCPFESTLNQHPKI